MNVLFKCTYCGHDWVEKRFFTSVQDVSAQCPKCGDKKVRAKDADGDRIDSYIGCPPFKDDKKIELDSPHEMYDDKDYGVWGD